MLRSKLAMTLIAGCLAVAAPLGAAHAELKIGMVNFDALWQQSPQSKAMQQALRDEFASRERDLNNQQKDLKTKLERFQRDSAVMTDAEKAKLERELREGQREYERKGNELKDDFNLRQNEEVGKLQRALVSEVEAFAKSSNYDLIVGMNVVLYGKDTFDVTNQVLSILQQRAAKSAGPAATPAKPAPVKP